MHKVTMHLQTWLSTSILQIAHTSSGAFNYPVICGQIDCVRVGVCIVTLDVTGGILAKMSSIGAHATVGHSR